jgi:hypothetical protein
MIRNSQIKICSLQKNITFVSVQLMTNANMLTSDQLFLQLILIFHQNAMIAMGKLKNPMTDKVERDLGQAKQSIDMLEMIREKTKNNLSAELSGTLDHALTELRLNFVDESNKQTVTT